MPGEDRAVTGEVVRRWYALSVCLVALFMTLLDVSITNVALPAIGAAVGAHASQLQWVVSGYTLAFGLVPIIGGRLGDDHGRRRMFLVGVAGFVATSALVGAAPEPRLLIAGRVAQGLFGGLINAQVSGLVQQMFRGAQRARAFGAIGTVVGVATAAALAGRWVHGLGRPLVVGGLAVFGTGAVLIDLVARLDGGSHAALRLAVPPMVLPCRRRWT
jgi:MFS family permease